MKFKNLHMIRSLLCFLLATAMIFTTLGATVIADAADASFEAYLTAQGFPESYKTYLRQLHSKYPQWVFTAQHVNLDWNEVIKNEGVCGRNLVSGSAKDEYKCKDACCYKNGKYVVQESGGWVCASETAIANYMDPRNYLSETYIFQFEDLAYNASQTIAGIEGILKGSFMANTKISYKTAGGQTVNTGETYAQVILQAAKQSGASAYYIASKIRQEIGTTPSPSVTGTFASYPGIYNFYNINAGSGSTPIANCLKWASSSGSYGRPWNTPQKSILGGASFIANGYINAGQNTSYLQKFNVAPKDPSTMYWHQYMTNVSGAVSEAGSTYRGYQSLGTLSLKKEFLIPVYKNMPNVSEPTTANVKINDVNNKMGTVTGNYVNIRSGAGTSYSVLKVNGKDVQLVKGNSVKVLGETKTSSSSYPVWYKISCIFSGVTQTGYIAANYLKLDASRTLGAGETCQLSVTKTPANSLESVQYSSASGSVASVSSQGLITAKAKGTAVITAYTSSGSRDSILVSVVNAPSSLSINRTNASLKRGETLQLTSTVNSGSAAAARFYSSGNSSVATVNQNGLVTAVSAGTAVITVKTYNNVSAKCTVVVAGDAASITMTPKTAELTVGQSTTLKAVPSPNAQSPVTWKSSNTNIVTVSGGTITAKAVGTATITATSNGVSATCAVTVKSKTQSVLLSEGSCKLGVGEKKTLIAAVTPAGSGTVQWSSSNMSVASVSNGIITAKAVGTAKITATVNGVSDTCTVTVGAAPSSVTVTPSSLSLNVEQRAEVKASINTGAVSSAPLSYVSSNTNVAKVDANGIVSAVGVGTATITVKSYNGKTAVCSVTVKGNTQSVSLNRTSVTIGVKEVLKIYATVLPANSGTVTWSSNNTSVATVDSNGNITGKSTGVATIRATSNGKTASCTVTVGKAPTSISLNYTKATIKVGQMIDLNSSVPSGQAVFRRLFTSNNPSVAEVTLDNGYVTGKQPGTCTITVSVYNGVKATCQITVVDDTKNATGTVTGDWVNVRSGPGTNYSNIKVNGVSAMLAKNTKVTILGQQSSNSPSKSTWYKISFISGGKTYTGYIISTYCKQTAATVTGTITGDYVNVRSGPGTNYGIIRSGNSNVMLRKGTVVTILERQNGKYPTNSTWCKVKFSYNGSTTIGYVITTYIK